MLDIDALIKNEGWTLFKNELGHERIKAFDQDFPVTHPVNIHLKLYRTLKNPERKYFHMKAAHDYLWPEDVKTWNYWTERRFRAHCEGFNYITYAGGANIGKSYDGAKVGLLFYLSNPKERTVIVASTTLAGLDSRIWGYIKKLYSRILLPLPTTYTGHPSPKIIFDKKKSGEKGSQHENVKDTLHGMFAVAAKKGDDDEAISGWIGKHPKDSLLLILDEATDMPLAITKAFANLEAKPDKFQLIAIGNSLSKFDLHGTLSTPKTGWPSIDPLRDNRWETTQRNGVCLFFSCYESPAIHETNPDRKKALSEIFVTEEELKIKEVQLGRDNDEFWRFVLGFWRTSSSVEVVIPSDHIERFKVQEYAEWSGVYPLTFVAGLDPSFTTGGDNCMLSLGLLGVDINGRMVLDFRRDELLFKIPVLANTTKSVELQIVDNTLDILRDHGCKLENLCIDGNGAGRGLAETMRLRCNGFKLPLRVISTRLGNGMTGMKEDGIIIKSAYDLWFNFKGFMETQQIKGMDSTTAFQLTNRLIKYNEKTKKIQLETKADFKKRMGHILKSMARSPDEADARSFTLQAAVANFGFYPGQAQEIQNNFMTEKMYYYHTSLAKQQSQEVVHEVLDIHQVKAGFLSSVEDLVSAKKSILS